MANEINKKEMTNETEQKVTLRTADAKTFDVELPIAKKMEAVNTFISDDDASVDVIPLANVNSRELSKILEYLRCPSGDTTFEDSLKVMKDQNELKELLLAANYLNVNDLIDLITKTIANFIQNKTVEFVRTYFGFENDFTPDEEKQIWSENAWAFEGVSDD